MKKQIYYFLTFLVFASLVSCRPKYVAPEISKGEIDPSKFVMIGGGHIAGYMNDGLTYDGQINSLANIIADQFKLVGGGEFNQPLVNQNSVGISLNGLSSMKLGYKTDCEGVNSLSPVRLASAGDVSIWNNHVYNSILPFGNFGIPNFKLTDINSSTWANTNPFFARMASSANTTVKNDILASNPSFFSIFLGIDDVLEYAKSGGTINNLTSSVDFEIEYSDLVSSLVQNGSKGALATIPDVTKMPFFSTIPWNGLTLDDANAQTLNNVYNSLGYSFQVGSNPFMVTDSSANMFAVRQILNGEKLTLSIPLDSVKCNKMGVLFPFRDEFYLDLNEINFLNSKIEAYNNAIRSIASTYNLAIVEVDKFISNLNDGFIYNGVSMSAKFVSGGAYSLDGIYLNPKGNALLANEFLKAINKKYNARIPLVDAGKYNATFFP